MVWDYTTSGAVLAKAGANVSVETLFGITSGARLENAYKHAMGTLSAETAEDWTTDIPSVKTEFSGAVADVVSSLAAMEMIEFDMSGYTSRSESRLMLNMNENIARKGISNMKNKNITQKAMGV